VVNETFLITSFPNCAVASCWTAPHSSVCPITSFPSSLSACCYIYPVRTSSAPSPPNTLSLKMATAIFAEMENFNFQSNLFLRAKVFTLIFSCENLRTRRCVFVLYFLFIFLQSYSFISYM
jgi:hypothetical protein